MVDDIDLSAGSQQWATLFDLSKAIGYSDVGAWRVADREQISSAKALGQGRALLIHKDRFEEFVQRHVRPARSGRPPLRFDDPSLISVAEAAKILDVPYQTLRYWMRKGWIDGWERRPQGYAFQRSVIEDFAGVSAQAERPDVAG